METKHHVEPAVSTANGAYYNAPAAELLGNAGTLSPGEREQRYQPFLEKQRLDH